MNVELECERTLLVQADFDGELDAGQAVALIEHERQCEQCRRVREQLARSRALMRAAPRFAVAPELRASIARRLQGAGEAATSGEPAPRPPRSGDVPTARRWFVGAPSFRWASALAAAAVLIAILLVPRAPDVGTQLVGNHLRAMQLESHLVDVVSTDHHTVKPWFAGKVSFAPVVKQLESDGYNLKGGRVDIVNAAPAAVLVYEAGRHVIDVYMWPAAAGSGAPLQDSQIEGFNLRHWQESGLAVWCISDASADELTRFAEHWQSR
jgi:anti-sigma factor RsiW